MHVTRRPRATGALLALVCCLALLEPGAAGRAAADAHAPGSPAAGPVAAPGHGLLQGRPGRSWSSPAGPATNGSDPARRCPACFALAVAAAATLVAARRAARPAGHRAVAAAARAPPPLQPAAS